MVRRREISPVELVETALSRIELLDSRLGSMVTVDAEGALEAASAAADRAGAEDAAPFLGVPTAIKDLHVTDGMRTTFGTASMAEFVPNYDEWSVGRLRSAGFILLGKTNVSEFGTVPYTESALLGPARNPWDLDRSPGGSSGGAGAAVAAGLIPVAHASDGGGSVRIPASACGLFGIKPARGRISNAPQYGEQVGGLSTVGLITRDVGDAAAMLDEMHGYVAGDPNWASPPDRPFAKDARGDPPALRVGLALSSPLHTFGAESLDVAQETAELLTGLGHVVEPIDLPVTEQLISDFRTLWTARVSALPVDPDGLEPYNRFLFEEGASYTAPDLLKALTSAQLLARAIVRAALSVDVVACPTLTRDPLRIGELEGLDHDATFAANIDYVGLTPLANLTGQPAMSVPLGTSERGLPVGMQFIGPPDGESTLLRLAGQLERATPWAARRPALNPRR